MSHPAINNNTPFAFEPLFLSDQHGQPILVCVVKATLGLAEGGKLLLAEEQVPVTAVGEYWGKPGKSSYKYEPESALRKTATDIVLIADAYARRLGDPHVDVRFEVGRIKKTIRVTGERYWMKSLGMMYLTPPEPFESIPLVYERAFGGWDPGSTEEKPLFDRRNPVGTGYHRNGHLHESLRLPNLEDPTHLIREYSDAPEPAGFGFISPDWVARAKYAGTYDAKWRRSRMPLLPEDFDQRFFNAASPGLIAPTFLRGDEPISLSGATPNGSLDFDLPGIAPPACRVELVTGGHHDLALRFDTLIVNGREHFVLQIWRAALPLRNGPHDVDSIRVGTGRLPAPGQEF